MANLWPHFGNLSQHRCTNFVEINFFSIPQRYKTGTCKNPSLNDTDWACANCVHRWALLYDSRGRHECRGFKERVGKRVWRSHAVKKVVQTGENVLVIRQLGLKNVKNRCVKKRGVKKRGVKKQKQKTVNGNAASITSHQSINRPVNESTVLTVCDLQDNGKTPQ